MDFINELIKLVLFILSIIGIYWHYKTKLYKDKKWEKLIKLKRNFLISSITCSWLAAFFLWGLYLEISNKMPIILYYFYITTLVCLFYFILSTAVTSTKEISNIVENMSEEELKDISKDIKNKMFYKINKYHKPSESR